MAGLEGVKHDLEEVVEFLKNPEKFQRLGGRVPKGILLMGPPGTGKTLLARAVAGEAGVPFFSISGSEFIQMFVGVGASRVRDMFKTAKEASPCILFIDEIDAVGRVRGAGLGGGHDEREQTLNQILSEMDGFSQTESVIVLAATNRPDVLDPALLRPGRFDRHITVDRPNHKGRLAIFKVHVREVPLADDVDLDRLASGTVGLTGADIRNLVNEAALWATRKGKDKVDMNDFEHARDRVLMGPKREEVLSGKEKRMTAIHESGHALLAWIVPGADRVHKVTIIPRGRSLGVTQLVPEEDRLNISESELHGRLCFMLGGRAAEKLIFDEYSAGAENDLMQATRLARRMVTAWGMSERLGPVAYRTSEEHPFLGKEIHEQREFSEHSGATDRRRGVARFCTPPPTGPTRSCSSIAINWRRWPARSKSRKCSTSTRSSNCSARRSTSGPSPTAGRGRGADDRRIGCPARPTVQALGHLFGVSTREHQVVEVNLHRVAARLQIEDAEAVELCAALAIIGL